MELIISIISFLAIILLCNRKVEKDTKIKIAVVGFGIAMFIGTVFATIDLTMEYNTLNKNGEFVVANVVDYEAVYRSGGYRRRGRTEYMVIYEYIDENLQRHILKPASHTSYDKEEPIIGESKSIIVDKSNLTEYSYNYSDIIKLICGIFVMDIIFGGILYAILKSLKHKNTDIQISKI